MKITVACVSKPTAKYEVEKFYKELDKILETKAICTEIFGDLDMMVGMTEDGESMLENWVRDKER